MLNNKTLLITGGTGSFGNAVIRRFLNTGIKEIRVFSRDEKKQDDMRNAYRNDKLKFYIGNVRDYDSIHSAMHGVDYVFHAAALKQVPSCEFFPVEAVKTNILGTENVLNAAVSQNVRKVMSSGCEDCCYDDMEGSQEGRYKSTRAGNCGRVYASRKDAKTQRYKNNIAQLCGMRMNFELLFNDSILCIGSKF